jgi:cytoskeletal protein CcmA (bactofilin family)
MNGGTRFNGSLTSNNNFTVKGKTNLNGGATVTGGATTDSLFVNDWATTNSLIVNGTASVNGSASLNGGATVTGGLTSSNDFAVNGKASLNGGATVTGGLTSSNDFAVNGKASLNGATTVTGGLTVDNLTVSGSNSFVPAGTIISFVCKNKPSNPTTNDGGSTYTGGNAPTGYLWCDGTSLTTSGKYNGVSNAFMNLYNTIGTIYGGTGTGTSVTGFNLPNLQGAFLRGCGNQTLKNVTNGFGKTVDVSYNGPFAPGSGVSAITKNNYSNIKCDNSSGGVQTHATQQHDHNVGLPDWISKKNGGGGSDWVPWWSKGDQSYSYTNPIQTSTTEKVYSADKTVNIASYTVAPETVFVDTTETRPFNYGVYYLIKY